MNIDKTSIISLSAKLDKTNPAGVNVGAYTYIAFGVSILTHDMCRALKVDTTIGDNCFIGARSIIMPGIIIGNSCIVAAGSIVTKSVPDNSIVAGNPAVVIKKNIKVSHYGVFSHSK